MIAAERVAVILLAAGRSRRFGEGDKLLWPLHGMALGLHAARTLSQLPFVAKIAVTRERAPDYAAHGFTSIVNPDPDIGQSGSIRIGLAGVRPQNPSAVLIALADMPFITISHVLALTAHFDDNHPIVASSGGGSLGGPPALFGAPLFDALDSLTGDAGARSLLAHALLLKAPAQTLADIDLRTDVP